MWNKFAIKALIVTIGFIWSTRGTVLQHIHSKFFLLLSFFFFIFRLLYPKQLMLRLPLLQYEHSLGSVHDPSDQGGEACAGGISSPLLLHFHRLDGSSAMKS